MDGTLSPAQGAPIAGAAADADPQATHDRIHRERRCSEHTDVDGTFNLRAHGTVAEGSVLSAELARLTDGIFRERSRAGSRECREAYAFDALVEMARRSQRLDHQPTAAAGGRRKQAAPEHLALLRLDVAALWRGHVEGDELCEITGLGPIPVETARRLLGDAVIKLIITSGEAVAHVTSLTRGPTQAMKYALLWTSPTCVVEGCSRTIVEHDHRTGREFKDTRHTRLDELDRLCPGHHDLHTRERWALVKGTGKRPMVPPSDVRHPGYGFAPPGDPPNPQSGDRPGSPSNDARPGDHPSHRTADPPGDPPHDDRPSDPDCTRGPHVPTPDLFSDPAA